MSRRTRRIVTGHNAEGKSIFLFDGPCPHVQERGNGNVVESLWRTESCPVDNSGDEDPGPPERQLDFDGGATAFRIVEYAPDEVRRAAIEQTVGPGGKMSDHYIDGARHFGFHKTDSIDYAIVLEGEIYALMDEGETLMKAGDVLIQRGTAHAWSNRSDRPCRVAFVLVDAKPV